MRGDGPVHAQEQVQHALGPLLRLDLVEKRELAQQVGIAEAVNAVQLEVGAPAIVDEPAGEAGQKGEVLDGVAAALAVDAVPREGLGADDMEPVERAGHTQAGFVGVGDGSLGDEVRRIGLEAGQGVVGGGDGGLDGRLADGPAEEVCAHLADALQRDQRLAAQVDQPGVEARAVLRGGGDADGEGGRNLATGIRAARDLDAVLGDEELLRGQIEDLSCIVTEHGQSAKAGVAAAGAARDPVDDDNIGLARRQQSVAWMSALPAGTAAALFAQAFGVGRGVAVG